MRIDDEERWLSPALSEFEGGSVLAVRDATGGYVLERTRADFVATASHELRTPLTAGLRRRANAASPTATRSSAASRTACSSMIEQESEHLVQIVDQLLVSAQLDRGAVHLDVSECRRPRALLRASSSRRACERSRGTCVMLQMPTAIAPLRCDEALLRQVLVNLVENAIKYSPEGGRVDVLVRDDPGRVQHRGRRRGDRASPPAEQERIFEKFYRLDAAMSRGVGGSGLGLYISREIVMQMGGVSRFSRSRDVGSTFTVTLPRDPLIG